MKLRADLDRVAMNAIGTTCLPGLLGMRVVSVSERELVMAMSVRPKHLAPNGFLHAGSVVALADTACGYATIAHLPEAAESFTTIELKSNFLGTATSGELLATARAVHGGRATQVWDATVSEAATGRALALFRCTQMILYPKN